MQNRMRFAVVVAALFLMPLGALLAQEGAGNRGFTTVHEILSRSCSACHDWTETYQDIVDPARVVPGAPEKSAIYIKISDDTMPMKGPKLTSLEKALIKSWIAAGAPESDAPIPEASAAASGGFLGFPNKVVFHEVSGFTSGALFLAAGIIGVVHFVDMMNEGHAWRDAYGWTEGMPESIRSGEISTVWGDQQNLRRWHIGLLSTGEVFYLANVFTGISMWSKDTPGLTPQKIHKIAFITHVTLMVAQVTLGFFSTWAMQTGQHDLMIGLGAAHAAIGITIPLVIIGSGVANMVLLQ
ncbi:MAG TPA: hypothetical protein VMV03_05715 [Spirochaetia bacterium]|nr:hypothetical protein [Spirochaetia bacterium]